VANSPARAFIINAHVSQLEPATQLRLASLQHYFLTHGLPDPAAAMHRAVIAVGQIVRTQATVMGYADCFFLLGLVLIGSVVSVALLKKGASAEGGAH
jgi:DHA2 family multidrug resistance protein